MNDLHESLKNIGLSDKEVRVYLALLRFGSTNVGNISDEAGIKRPTTYLILDELRKKGLVLKIPHAKKTIYQAKSPDELYEQIQQNLNNFEKILPKLRVISPSPKAIKTLYFEGFDGVKEAMYYRMSDLENSSIAGFFARDTGVGQKLLDFFVKWNKDLREHNIETHGVSVDHPSIRKFKEENPEIYKFLTLAPEEKYSSDVSIEVTKEFVRILDPHDLKAIIIENPRVVNALSQIFKLAQEKLKDSVVK